VKYDVIVVGGGLGGLTCAALLAKRKHRVILLERNSRVGGYATTFQRTAPDGSVFTMEASIHWITGCEDEGVVKQVLREVGVEDSVEFIPLGRNILRIVFPDGRTIRFPCRKEDFIQELTAQFPEEKANIMNFFDDMNGVWSFLHNAHLTFPSQRTVMDLDKLELKRIAQPLGRIFSYHFSDVRVCDVLYAPLSYYGLGFQDISFLEYAVFLREFFTRKGYWIKGGSQKLSDAFANAILKQGGVVRTNTLVKKILTERGKVVGVEVDDGSVYYSDYVVSNADPFLTFFHLVGAENLPDEFVRALLGMTATWSFFKVYLGLDDSFRIPAPFSSDYEVLILKEYGVHEFAWKEEFPVVGITNYTEFDPTLAPRGKNFITIMAPIRVSGPRDWGVSNYQERNEEYRRMKKSKTKKLIEIAEGIYSGLSQHILVREAATPLTFQRFTLNRNGCIGFDIKCGRLPQQTPIEGLYLSGGWTEPHGGVLGVITSGKQAAEIISGQIETQKI